MTTSEIYSTTPLGEQSKVPVQTDLKNKIIAIYEATPSECDSKASLGE
jgi:hypothetical protein